MDIRTDLAVEAANIGNGLMDGVECEEEKVGKVKIERIRIKTEDAAGKIGKKCGNYITLTVDDLSDNEKEDYEEVCLCVAKELKNILNIEEKAGVLAVGLGNENITADSIGPKCMANLLVTRHLKKIVPEEIDERVREVSALTPSVMARTGIETQQIVQAVTEKIKPEAVIVVDALAARSMTRLGRTIQIADTGINPGSGVGNNRKELSEESLGVKVIAIGVPMVVDAVTVAFDCMEMVAGKESGKYIEAYKRKEPGSAQMVVTAKDVDSLSDRSARIIANGINLALQPLGREDIDRYNQL